jgi:hypothetical protein
MNRAPCRSASRRPPGGRACVGHSSPGSPVRAAATRYWAHCMLRRRRHGRTSTRPQPSSRTGSAACESVARRRTRDRGSAAPPTRASAESPRPPKPEPHARGQRNRRRESRRSLQSETGPPRRADPTPRLYENYAAAVRKPCRPPDERAIAAASRAANTRETELPPASSSAVSSDVFRLRLTDATVTIRQAFSSRSTSSAYPSGVVPCQPLTTIYTSPPRPSSQRPRCVPRSAAASGPRTQVSTPSRTGSSAAQAAPLGIFTNSMSWGGPAHYPTATLTLTRISVYASRDDARARGRSRRRRSALSVTSSAALANNNAGSLDLGCW